MSSIRDPRDKSRDPSAQLTNQHPQIVIPQLHLKNVNTSPLPILTRPDQSPLHPRTPPITATATMAPSTLLAARAAIPRAATRATASSPTLLAASRALAVRGYATPKGPPPAGFRTSKKVEWYWEKDSLLDRMGKYFLLSEMARGMYLLLEQFFRPP
jgi:hypothetical protein